MKVQQLAEGGHSWTRDLAGRAPGCSLLIVISVCLVGVCLSERRGGSGILEGLCAGVPETGLGAHSPCVSGRADGWRLRGSSRVTVTPILSLSLWLWRPLDCLLRSLCLYSLAFWVGLDWFLTGYFHVLWKCSPLLFSSRLLSIPAPEASNRSPNSLTAGPKASVVVCIVNVFIIHNADFVSSYGKSCYCGMMVSWNHISLAFTKLV